MVDMEEGMWRLVEVEEGHWAVVASEQVLVDCRRVG